jgi:hypothetical protein
MGKVARPPIDEDDIPVPLRTQDQMRRREAFARHALQVLARSQRAGEVGAVPLDADFSDVVFLTHFDNAVPVDVSASAHTITLGTGATIESSAAKFGPTSLQSTDVVTSFASVPSSSDFHFTDVNAAGAFTLEAWIRYTSYDTPVNRGPDILSMWDVTGNQRSWLIAHDANLDKLKFFWSTTGTNEFALTPASTFVPTLDQWYHVAVDRDSSNDVRLYLDGVVLVSANFGTGPAFHTSTANFQIGRRVSGSGDVDHDGYFDEVRITKGTARYGGAFTPPTAPFPNS